MLHREAGPAALALFRIAVFGLWAVHLVTRPVTRTANVPAELFTPPGAVSLLPEALWAFLFQPVPAVLLQAVLLGLVLAATLGARPFWLFGPLAFVAALWFDGMMKGWGGFMNHAQAGILYASLLIALCPAADRLSLFGPARPRRGPGAPYRYPLIGTAIVLCLAYALIGGHRIAVGGVAIFTGDALPTYLALRTFEFGIYQFDLSGHLLQSARWVLILKVGFAVTTAFEVLSPVALLSRRFRLAWLLVIVPFHVVTLFTMNIFFWENLILIGLVMTDLPSRFERWWDLRPRVLDLQGGRGGLRALLPGVRRPIVGARPPPPPSGRR